MISGNRDNDHHGHSSLCTYRSSEQWHLFNCACSVKCTTNHPCCSCLRCLDPKGPCTNHVWAPLATSQVARVRAHILGLPIFGASRACAADIGDRDLLLCYSRLSARFTIYASYHPTSRYMEVDPFKEDPSIEFSTIDSPMSVRRASSCKIRILKSLEPYTLSNIIINNNVLIAWWKAKTDQNHYCAHG